MEEAEREFWIAIGLWGASAVTVLGTGLFALVEGFYKSGIPLTVVGLGCVMYVARHLRGRRLSIAHSTMGALILTWMFFGYAIYTVKASPASPHPRVLIGWNELGSKTGTNACNGAVSGDALSEWSSAYDVALVCMFPDPRVDFFKNASITVTQPFTIIQGAIPIEAPFSPAMIDAEKHIIDDALHDKPQGTIYQFPIWYEAILVPKDFDMSLIRNLSDVTAHGGKLLSKEPQDYGAIGSGELSARKNN
jgi:hypothetical protein